MIRIALLSTSALAALALAACGAPQDPEPAGDAPEADTIASDGAETSEADPGADPSTLSGAVEAPWRDSAAQARDGERNPLDTITFFDLDPSGTVIEIWPGGGWYADILAPWISANGGTYVAAWPPVPAGNTRAEGFRARFQERYDGSQLGSADLVTFGPGSADLSAAGSADAVLTFRNIHNFMAAGFGETAFESFFDVLKPGGVLGVVEHRLPADRVQDPRAASGYVQQDYVISMAQEAGFEFVAASEINANPADTADHPFGVWTLAPVARTSAFGEPADPAFDRTPYDAIGESDRMTLLFRKPVSDEVADQAEDGAAP